MLVFIAVADAAHGNPFGTAQDDFVVIFQNFDFPGKGHIPGIVTHIQLDHGIHYRHICKLARTFSHQFCLLDGGFDELADIILIQVVESGKSPAALIKRPNTSSLFHDLVKGVDGRSPEQDRRALKLLHSNLKIIHLRLIFLY